MVPRHSLLPEQKTKATTLVLLFIMVQITENVDLSSLSLSTSSPAGARKAAHPRRGLGQPGCRKEAAMSSGLGQRRRSGVPARSSTCCSVDCGGDGRSKCLAKLKLGWAVLVARLKL